MILAIESAIVERLKTALAPLPVEALPARGYRFTHARGAALVLASDLAAGGIEDVGAAAQGATLSVEVVLLARSLRDGAGVWDMFEAARRALLSFKPAPGCSPLALKVARLEQPADDHWALSTRWQTLIPLAPDLDYDGGPLLTRVTFEEV
ncbi:Gp37 family protein [Thiofaba sp. EF100]|uniref:Gp37 family protein n=1 Tax=Thiofaba sp. EF100 TaxID=3121274 RepID=UPI0032215419